jgi:hypothetical protein
MMHQEVEVHVYDMQNRRKKKIICKFWESCLKVYGSSTEAESYKC